MEDHVDKLLTCLYKKRWIVFAAVMFLQIGYLIYGLAVYDIGGADVFLAFILMFFPYIMFRWFMMSPWFMKRTGTVGNKKVERGSKEYDRSLEILIIWFAVIQAFFTFGFFAKGYLFAIYCLPAAFLGVVFGQGWRIRR